MDTVRTMTDITAKLNELLDLAQEQPLDISEEDLDKFAEDCKEIIRKQFMSERRSDEFSLRMSNIGKPLRQLMLEKEHGYVKKEPRFKMLVTYGDMIEALVMLLLNISKDIEVEGEQKEVVVEAAGEQITGTYDLALDGKVYDIKSCSPFSFDNKFNDYQYMKVSDDDFGYLGQLHGYAAASGLYPGGWIVVNKVLDRDWETGLQDLIS